MTLDKPVGQGQDDTWTSETLPLTRRRELMKRELSQVLETRHNDAHASANAMQTPDTAADGARPSREDPEGPSA